MSLKNHIFEFAKQKKYFSVPALRKELKKKRIQFQPISINQYLSELKKEGLLFDAGRGWYSTIATPLNLDTSSLEEFVKSLSSKFPLLKFSCWSTKQIEPFAHHLLLTFVHFLYADADSLPTLFEELRESGYQAFLNPRKGEAERYFMPTNRTVVLRPSVSEEPVEKHYAKIEKLIVDLYIEREKLSLMDSSEYKRVFFNIVYERRINMASLLRYSKRREVRSRLLSEVLASDSKLVAV